MQFNNPEYLLILLAAPLLLWLLKYRKGAINSHIAFSDFRNIRTRADIRTALLHLFDALALILLALALARPVSVDKVVTPPVEGKDIMIALDVSGSMEALDFEPKNRIEAAKSVIDSFVRGRKSDRLGLVFFASDSFLQVPLTTDYTMFTNLLERITTGAITDGTAIGNGLGLALSRLDDSKAKSRLIILLTDGENNAGNVSPQQAAALAKEEGVKIYTILIGSDKPVRYPAGKNIFGQQAYTTARFAVNPALMQELAETTGGRFYRSISSEELKIAFAEIDKLEKSPLPAKTYTLYKEFAPHFILLALALLLLARLLALLFPLYPEVER